MITAIQKLISAFRATIDADQAGLCRTRQRAACVGKALQQGGLRRRGRIVRFRASLSGPFHAASRRLVERWQSG